MMLFKFGQLVWQVFKGRALNQQKASEALVQALSQMPGLPRKLAQNLAPERGRELEFKNATVPLFLIKKTVQAKSPSLFAQITEWDETPQVASLGQVNRVRLKDGRELAIKTLLPGVRRELITQTNVLLRTFESLKQLKSMDFDTAQFSKFFHEQLAREVDYTLEIESQQEMREIFSGSNEIYVPAVYPQWSHDDVLVQEFVPGQGLEALKQQPIERQRQVANQLGQALRRMLFEVGVLHGDLHAKNWAWSPSLGRIVLYDFGSMLRFTPTQLEGLKRLLRGDGDCLAAWGQVGFDEKKLRELNAKLPQMTEILLSVFRTPPPWQVQERLDALLGADKWIFRQAGPPWFMWVMRTLSSVLASLEQLGGQDAILAPITREGPVTKKLLILVRENGEETVRVELPVRAMENLADLVPEETGERIRESGISLKDLAEKSKAQDYPVGVVFEQVMGVKHYLVKIIEK